ncbi:PH domain-containing protein [Nocardioides houyundeii]|uniref:PH domain-containing protein n=1 Tax=Nocardioides houyundeii TaxID=2045452 RepID=UPI000DF45181|nr:PH domain-containing protein [Nocardioides houyundeii]
MSPDEPSAAAPEGDVAVPWHRLDPRKLLLDPVKALGQLIVPILAIVVGVGSRDPRFFLATPVMILAALALGAIPWLTTYYRITDGQLQLRRGLLNKKSSTVRLERVRSVDLEASLLHRVLGLRKVEIGTGVDDERIVLDAVSVQHAASLRALLLTARASAGEPAQPVAAAGSGTAQAPGEQGLAPSSPADAGPTGIPTPVAWQAHPEEELARIDWTWLRFAPFSLARLVIVVGAVGFVSQVADDLPFLDGEHIRDAWRWVTGFALASVVTGLLVAGLLGWLLLSVAGYVAQWWGLRLTRGDGSLHLTSGLFTTRSISVEEQRVRGVLLTEKALLRLVGGAELATLATGVAGGVTTILPPSPVRVAADVAGTIVEDEQAVRTPLLSHGPAARRRTHVRAQFTTAGLALLLVALAVLNRPWEFRDLVPGWAPLALVLGCVAVAAACAEASYAHLGNALTERHLVAGSGITARNRTVLETDGIIGWVARQSLFQRRAGLVTLTATTAAGNERVVLRDVPHDRAMALVHGCTPAPLAPFLVAAHD